MSQSQVLARVATGVHEIPRGPDVVHRVAVKRSWLERGDVIEFELPRNLACAACAGGGCDSCGRSGAISLRSRRDPAARLTVPLPKRTAEEMSLEPSVVLRVPEQGGLAEPGSDLPRGLLLLRIVAAAKTDAGVKRVKVAPGLASLAPTARASAAPGAGAALDQEDVAPPSLVGGTARRPALGLVWVLLAVCGVLAVLYFSVFRR